MQTTRLILRQPLHGFSTAFYSIGRPVVDTSKWVPTIGLEIHVQLTSVKSKLFSPAPYFFAAPPNTQIAPLDAALPGAMPILNRACVNWALVASLALKCRVNTISQFDRKHYFYADSPSGYQITQHTRPIAENGRMDYIWWDPSVSKQPRIDRATVKRIQLEQDTGKSLHDEKGERSLIDLNRAGVGLVEIVTNPDFTNGIQAAAFVDELSTMLRFLRVCSANMSTGELRVDVNVSLGPSVREQGPVVEVKNINSLRSIRHAIDFEIKRQNDVVRLGQCVVNETRSFDMQKNVTVPMRDKEVVQDYRFLREPDLPLLRIRKFCEDCQTINDGRQTEAPPQKTPSTAVCLGCIALKHGFVHQTAGGGLVLPITVRQRLVFEHGLSLDRAAVLVETPKLRNLYESTVKQTLLQLPLNEKDPFISILNNYQEGSSPERLICKEVAYWCCGLLLSIYRSEPDSFIPTSAQLSQFVVLNLTGKIFGEGSARILNKLCEEGEFANPVEVAQQDNLLLDSNVESIQVLCDSFVKENLAMSPILVKAQAHLFAQVGFEASSQKTFEESVFLTWVVSKLPTRLHSIWDEVRKYTTKGRKKRVLQSMVNRLLATSTRQQALHPAVVEHCLVESCERSHHEQ